MLMRLYEDIGFKVDYFFSNLSEATYQDGPILLTGRDLIVFVAGGLSMFALILAIIGIKDTFTRRKQS